MMPRLRTIEARLRAIGYHDEKPSSRQRTQDLSRHAGISCGKCGHVGDYGDFMSSEVYGELPVDVWQCPKCKAAVQKRRSGLVRIPAYL